MLQAASQSSLLVRDVEGAYRDAKPEEVLQAALEIIGQRVTRGTPFASPTTAREFLTLRLGTLEHEVFAVLFLDAQNRLIEYSELFRGTATQTSVYPREVVKEALVRNSVAVILAHSVARHRMRLLCPEALCTAMRAKPRPPVDRRLLWPHKRA